MEKSIKITVPVDYTYNGKAYRFCYAVGSKIIGIDTEGNKTAFDYLTGKPSGTAVSDADLEGSEDRKVRRNYWARVLIKYWAGKVDTATVITAYKAEGMEQVFSEGKERLELLSNVPTLCDALYEIIEP